MKSTIACLLLAVASTPSMAAVTVYTNVGAFDAAAGATTNVDFQGCPSSGYTLANNQSVSSGGLCSGIPQGITFSPPTNNNLFISPAGHASNPTTALGLDFPQSGDITITLANASTVFGIDVFQNFGGGSQSTGLANYGFAFYNGNQYIANYSFPISPNVGSFFGFTGLSAFNRVMVYQMFGYATIDNVRFNGANAAAVPELATWALLMLGFGAVGHGLRRTPRVRIAMN